MTERTQINPTADSPKSGPGLLERFMAMKPLHRWVLVAAVAVLLWFFAEDYTWGWARSLNETSDRMQKALEEGSERSQIVESSLDVRNAIVAIGQIAVPRAEKDGTQELAKSIDTVMKANRVDGYGLDVRAGAKLPPNALTEIAGSDGRIEKVIGELKFDAAQEVVAKIIQELEERPEVESLSRIKLTRKEGGDKKLAVQMTVEAWIQVPKDARRGL